MILKRGTGVAFRHSLRFRLVAAALVVEVIVLAAMLASGLQKLEQQLRRQQAQHVQSLELAYRTAITVPLISRDYATLRDILDGWLQADELRYIRVSDQSGRVLAAAGNPPGKGALDGVMAFEFPVDYQGQRYGNIHLGLDSGYIAAATRELVWEGFAVAVVGILLTGLLLLATGLWLTRHLRRLTEAAARVAEGDYSCPLVVPTHDEIGLLARSFASMAGAVENRVQELAQQAGHDPLTGLHNRRAFEAYLDEALRLRTPRLCLLYLDLDQFKAVNDSCGHAAGDLLLQSLARMMNESFEADFIARLGGDEFAIVLLHLSPEEARRNADSMIERIRQLHFVWEGRPFQLGASIGLVQSSPHIDTVTAMLIAADTACYAAKERGRNRVEVYAPGDDYFRQREEELAALTGITAALQEDRFLLYFQRIAALRPGYAGHAEILVRMRDESGGLVPPARFIPAAERYNLMPFIDRWVIDASLARTAALQGCGAFPFHHVNINLSGASLAEESLLAYIAECIARHGVDPHLLCFEITESQAIGNLEGALDLIRELRRMGASVALDDFGSGLSSFGYLKRFEVDYLKIDGQFVRNLGNDPIDRATVEAIVGLARAHQLKTVAEFVCSEELVQIVRDLGVDYAQGYALHEPEPF